MNVFYTVSDVAKQLQLHKRTILRMIERGDLPCVRFGNQIRVTGEDLARMIINKKEFGRRGRGKKEADKTQKS